MRQDSGEHWGSKGRGEGGKGRQRQRRLRRRQEEKEGSVGSGKGHYRDCFANKSWVWLHLAGLEGGAWERCSVPRRQCAKTQGAGTYAGSLTSGPLCKPEKG